MKEKLDGHGYEQVKFMLDCYDYFSKYNTRENKKASRVIWHVIFTLDDEHHELMEPKDLLNEFAYFNKKLKRWLGYAPPYTRRIEYSDTGRLHIHCIYWSIPHYIQTVYKKRWKDGLLIMSKDGRQLVIDSREYALNIAKYFQESRPPIEVKRQLEHSQGLKKLICTLV